MTINNSVPDTSFDKITLINKIVQKFNPKAVIFDLDGTLIDNNPYHLETWKQYLKNSGRTISDEEYNKNVNGRTNGDVVRYLYGAGLSDAQVLKHTLEKEALYREIYLPHIKPIPGLLEFLAALQRKNIPMGIATSGITPNINFLFQHIPIKDFFKVVVNSSHIHKGKPDPEIYLKTASLLHVDAKKCLVFEDAVVGIKSAKAAGMKVVAVATTHPKNELFEADMIIRDYQFDKNRA